MPRPKIERNTHTIDASGKILGRLASEIAKLLQGKHKPDYTPNIDAGDIVEVSNVTKIKLSGKKMDQKVYYRHSGYPGGLKTRKISEAMEKDPTFVLRNAVSFMLPKNTFRSRMISRLRIKTVPKKAAK